jgi:hypothetical protein
LADPFSHRPGKTIKLDISWVIAPTYARSAKPESENARLTGPVPVSSFFFLRDGSILETWVIKGILYDIPRLYIARKPDDIHIEFPPI